MLYGLYHSAQGAQTQSLRLDVLSNNLANASTSGFKRQLALFQLERPYDVENGVGADPAGNQHDLPGGTSPATIVTDFSNGTLTKTGNAFDFGLAGPGFFQVTDGTEQYLTRDGQFSYGRTGELVSTSTGHRLMSTTGAAIVVPAEMTRVQVTADGSVWGFDADNSQTPLGKISIVQPIDRDKLQPIGNSLYRNGGDVLPAGGEAQLKQGFVESSGVSPVGEMMELIQATRAFETNVNMIKFQDEALGRLLQSAAGR